MSETNGTRGGIPEQMNHIMEAICDYYGVDHGGIRDGEILFWHQDSPPDSLYVDIDINYKDECGKVYCEEVGICVIDGDEIHLGAVNISRSPKADVCIQDWFAVDLEKILAAVDEAATEIAVQGVLNSIRWKAWVDAGDTWPDAGEVVVRCGETMEVGDKIYVDHAGIAWKVKPLSKEEIIRELKIVRTDKPIE